MELQFLPINISYCGDTFNFAKYLWALNRVENGYFTIGVPYLSSNSEVFYAAYPLSILINNSSFIYERLMSEEIIESALKNFYELGGKITFNSRGITFDHKISSLLDDEKIEKILYCIFLIHKFNRDNIFYIKQMENAMKFFPSDEVDLVIAKVIYNVFDILKVMPYIVKAIPITKDLISNIKNYREVVIWELYQNLRGILVTDKISLNEGKIDFEEEFFDSYIINNADSSFYVKPDIKEKATGYALVLVLRKMGNSALIYRPKINTENKFRTLLFMVISRLITLNRMNFIHGDLHAGNFVFEMSQNRWYSDYIQCEDIYIRNNIDLYNSFDLIDFGSAIEFHESDGLIDFIARVIPNIFANRKPLIERLARTSPMDLAIAASTLDLYMFIESFFSISKDYEQIKETRSLFQDYILEKFNAYLDSNDKLDERVQGMMYGGGDLGSSIIPDIVDEDMFIGGDPNPNYGNVTKFHNITYNILPLYKLLDHFYRHDSDLIDKSKIINTIQ
jgi:hypothetical protein